MHPDIPWIEAKQEDKRLVVFAGGPWNISNAAVLEQRLQRFQAVSTGKPLLDLSALTALDTTGALLLNRTATRLCDGDGKIDFRNARPGHTLLLEKVAAIFQPCAIAPPIPKKLVAILAQMGASAASWFWLAITFLSFCGEAALVFTRQLLRPRQLRFTSTIYHMEQAGINSLPIVSLMSFLIGIVLAYQGAQQMQRFGAEVYVVDLITVSVLREIGILITAIIVAGRSGSAYTAQIGTMIVNEEVDAVRTLGIDPMEILVLPRVVALVVMLPFVAFVADIMGLLGGGLICWSVLGIGPDLFLSRLKDAADLGSFWVGIIKAPIFALLIAMVGCFEGMCVRGSAESVGRRTTQAVVEAIFLVIVADALFSIFFSFIGI